MSATSLLKTVILLGVLLACSACSITHVMRIENREVIDLKTMIGELDTPVVLVGEDHRASSHHELQLEVIKKLRARGKTVAIGMEMFEESSQRALDAWSAGKVPEEAFRKVFQWNWRNISWDLYEDILLYARDHRIPIVALNAPREVIQKVAKVGVAELTSADLSRLPPGIELEITDAYLDLMLFAYSAHGGSGDGFRNICEAQMLRNRVMARRASDYLLLHPEQTLVVLAGGVHTWAKGGIPAELGELPYRVILPPMPGLNSVSVTREDADYLMEEPSWLGMSP